MAEHDWAHIRTTWDARATVPGAIKSKKTFATEFGMMPETLSRRISADAKAEHPWPEPLKAPKTENGSQKAGGRSKTPKAPGLDPEDDQPLESEQAALVEDPSGLKAIAVLSRAVVTRLLRRVARGKVAPGAQQSEADLAAKVVAMAKDVVVMERALSEGVERDDLNGVDGGARRSSVPGRSLEIRQRRLEPIKIPVDATGRAVDAEAEGMRERDDEMPTRRGPLSVAV